MEDQVWIDLVAAADQDNDGEITFEEFKKMMYVMYLNKGGGRAGGGDY